MSILGKSMKAEGTASAKSLSGNTDVPVLETNGTSEQVHLRANESRSKSSLF